MSREIINVFKVFIQQNKDDKEYTNFRIEKTLIRKGSKELNIFYKSEPYKEAEHYDYKGYFEGKNLLDVNRKIIKFMREVK